MKIYRVRGDILTGNVEEYCDKTVACETIERAIELVMITHPGSKLDSAERIWIVDIVDPEMR